MRCSLHIHFSITSIYFLHASINFSCSISPPLPQRIWDTTASVSINTFICLKFTAFIMKSRYVFNFFSWTSLQNKAAQFLALNEFQCLFYSEFFVFSLLWFTVWCCVLLGYWVAALWHCSPALQALHQALATDLSESGGTWYTGHSSRRKNLHTGTASHLVLNVRIQSAPDNPRR